jgi:ATP/maltotriose-dependent transcriptional regulator MalT
MHQKIPRVEGGRLFQSEREVDPILVGTLAWYNWLEQQSSFTFVDHTLTFTARKSVLSANGSYWKAYLRRQGKLYRIHLGHSHTLTLERLQAAAQAFAGERVPDEKASVPSKQDGSNRLTSPQSLRIALDVDHYTSLIQTKLYRPRMGTDLIPRPRLLERMNAGLGGKVTLVCAPAGFGKTTLLVTWVETIDRPTVWLSLDVHDDELASFVRSLTAALQSVFPDAFGSVASLLQATRFPALDSLVAMFSNDLADVAEDLLLVLDDCHHIRTSEVHGLLEKLVEHLPVQVHLVLSSRTDPHLPLARWLAQGHLHELRGSDLRFTPEETEAFLARELGSVAAHEVAGALEERTEGWIAVLRLAALSLHNAPDQKAFLERLAHAPEYQISRYLVEEVLGQLEPAVQELLDRMSMLEQFCTPLCGAIMGSDASNAQVLATLKWLERSNLFLVPLDERQGWHRFHHLFQGLLHERLHERLSQEEIALLHRRASAWYAEQGLIEEALEHAVAGGDGPGGKQLVEEHFFRAYEQERWAWVERWLRLLPEEQIQGSPCLLVAKAWLLQARGQLKDLPRLLTTAELLLTTSDSIARDVDDPQRRLLQALIAIFWSQFQYFAGQVQASLESARSALAWLQPGNEYVASIALAFQAWSRQALGHEDTALAGLNHALRERSTHLDGTARLLFAQARVYLAAGKLHQVERTARNVLQVAQEAEIALSQNFAHWLLGVVSYEWNALDAAIYHFSAVIANQHQAHFWVVEDAMRGLALAYQAQGLIDHAQETTRAMIKSVQEQHNMDRLMTAYAFCGRLALVQDDEEQAEQWLEMAGEQEVRGPMPFFADPPITAAWLLLAKGDEVSVAKSQVLLTRLLQHVEAMHDTRKMIEVLALQAWAYDLQSRESEALEVLEHALALGRPGGFVRTFTDLPRLQKVLAALRRSRKAQKVPDNKLDAYLQDILVAMSPASAHDVSPKELMRQEGLEPLTERELQILHLLEQGLTNREIAGELVVTSGTVKLHTKHVYRKLRVNNRQTAVTLARALGLLAAT